MHKSVSSAFLKIASASSLVICLALPVLMKYSAPEPIWTHISSSRCPQPSSSKRLERLHEQGDTEKVSYLSR
ncbi:MAG: hypothetical protein L6V79_00885 [Clostridium sp.]|nr:MAG: hypothetical protein L6V79_00885 [Clostridium sp.]